MEPDRRHGGLNDNLPEIPDEQVDRVEQEGTLHRIAVSVNGVKDGGQVHEKLGEHTPEVLNVPEKYKQCRQDQTHTDVEQHQQRNGVKQHNELPRKRDAVKNAKQEEHDQRQGEVDECLHIFGEQEQILGHVDLRENTGIAHKGGHALIRGLAEATENQVAAEQVSGVVLHIAAEKLGKHQSHDQQRQQWGQHTPRHAQHRALVLFLEVALDQFLKEEAIFS